MNRRKLNSLGNPQSRLFFVKNSVNSRRFSACGPNAFRVSSIFGRAALKAVKSSSVSIYGIYTIDGHALHDLGVWYIYLKDGWLIPRRLHCDQGYRYIYLYP
jgi:hypothetical protein